MGSPDRRQVVGGRRPHMPPEDGSTQSIRKLKDVAEFGPPKVGTVPSFVNRGRTTQERNDADRQRGGPSTGASRGKFTWQTHGREPNGRGELSWNSNRSRSPPPKAGPPARQLDRNSSHNDTYHANDSSREAGPSRSPRHNVLHFDPGDRRPSLVERMGGKVRKVIGEGRNGAVREERRDDRRVSDTYRPRDDGHRWPMREDDHRNRIRSSSPSHRYVARQSPRSRPQSPRQSVHRAQDAELFPRANIPTLLDTSKSRPHPTPSFLQSRSRTPERLVSCPSPS